MVAPKLARRRALAVAAAGLAAAALAGCSSGAGGSSSVGYVNVSAGIAQIGTAHRTAAPQLSGTTVAGKAYTTSYTGHVTVINVWGAWCTACREEAASFSEAAKKYAAKGVQFVGIDTLDNDANAQSYESRFGITYPSLADPDETLVLSLKSLIPSEGVPSTLIVDKTGKVAVRAIGGITEPELDQELTYALSGS
ncbi:MAG TPA: TlpA disulfide reductase family protein [Actinospica sp.]|jgi:thiol-disulfide isomerase/thioredoxin|nr:TlpA disulfide reductase family protein [Actinospica sp.]